MPILKLLSRSRLSSIRHSIEYVLREGKNDAQTGEVAEPMLHNIRSTPEDINGIVREITSNEGYRKQTATNRVYCYHTIISFSNLDKSRITPEKLAVITRKYFELRGNICAFALPHFNTESIHIHCIEGATFFKENRSTTMKKSTLLALKLELDRFVEERYPELGNSKVIHGQGKEYVTEQEYHLVKNGRSRKQEIIDLVNRCISTSTNRDQFIRAINSYGLLHYERNRNGEITGVLNPETGKKYRFKTLGVGMQKIKALDKPRELSTEAKRKGQLRDIRNEHNNKNIEFEH